MGHLDAEGSGGLPDEGDEEGTHDSLERKAKQITSFNVMTVCQIEVEEISLAFLSLSLAHCHYTIDNWFHRG